jgi:hypothetical protein
VLSSRDNVLRVGPEVKSCASTVSAEWILVNNLFEGDHDAACAESERHHKSDLAAYAACCADETTSLTDTWLSLRAILRATVVTNGSLIISIPRVAGTVRKD